MKKLISLLLSVFLLLAVAMPALGEEPVTITISAGWTEDSLPNWRALADEFEAQNPDIKIEIQWGNNDMTRLQAQFMSNDAPDINQTWKYAFNEFVDAGLVLELTDMYEENGWTDENLYGGVKQWVAPLSEVTLEDCHVYGVPDFINTSVLFYNTDIFAQYGLEEPTTLDELLHVCEVLTDNGVSPMVYPGSITGSTNILDLMAKIICQTTPMSTIMDIYNGEDTFMNESVVQAADILQKCVDAGLFDPKFLTYDDEQACAAFANGEGAMYCFHTAHNANLMALAEENPDFHYTIMKGINFVDEPVAMYSATLGANWIIPASCEHPEEAKRVLSWMFGLDAAKEAAADYGRITMFPEANQNITNEAIRVVVDNQLDTLSFDSFYMIDMVPSSVLSAMAAAMQEMVSGNMNSEELLQYTQEAMDTLISER